MTALVEFEKFLLSAFSAGELRRFIGYLPGGDRLVGELPGDIVAPADLAHKTARLLDRTGDLRTAELWDALTEARPGRVSEIRALRDKCGTTTQYPTHATPQPSSASSLTGRRKILFVSASPESAVRLAVDREFRELRAVIDASPHCDEFIVEIEPGASYDTLEKALQVSRPHILHLSCHGDAAGNLHLADKGDEIEDIPAEMFLRLLELLPGDLELVVLNACRSDVIAERIPPIVAHAIGMRDALRDKAAIDFTGKLYENLAAGASLRDAFDRACNKLRKHDAHESPRLFGE